MAFTTGKGWKTVAVIKRAASCTAAGTVTTPYGSAFQIYPISTALATPSGTTCYPLLFTDRLPFKSESMTEKIAIVQSEALLGEAGMKDQRSGNKTVIGGIVCDVGFTRMGTAVASASGSVATGTASGQFFCGVDMLWELALGTSYWCTGTVALASAYRNNYLPVDDLTESFSLIIDKQTEEHRFHGCMVKSFTIKGAAGGILETSADIIAKSFDLGSSAVIADSQIPVDNCERVLFSDFVFRMAPRTAILTGTDNIGIKDFTFTYNNNLSDAQFSSPDVVETTHTDGRLTRQPVRNGFREVTLEFTVPRYQGTAAADWGWKLEDWKTAGNGLQFEALASVSGSASQRVLDIKIPNCQIEELTESVDGAGAIEQKVKCRCYRGAGADQALGTYQMLDGRGTVASLCSAIVDEVSIEMAVGTSQYIIGTSSYQGRTTIPF